MDQFCCNPSFARLLEQRRIFVECYPERHTPQAVISEEGLQREAEPAQIDDVPLRPQVQDE
jgi:hypothetical protein